MSYRILHLSDTHNCHNLLNIPDNIDMVIHSGDCSNYRDIYKNEKEVMDFLGWFGELDIPNKVMCFGNHDGSVAAGLVSEKDWAPYGIHVLNNSSIEIDGYKIWGSPFTPIYGDWSYTLKRDRMHDLWQMIPDDIDILVTHGPPKGILDLTINYSGSPEQCGCLALRKRVFEIEPKLITFGHIHNTKGVNNAGTLNLSGLDTIFSNGSCVTDGKMGQLSSHGNIIELNRK